MCAARVHSLQFTIIILFRRKTARERMTNADDIIHYNILLYTVLLVYRETYYRKLL